MDDLAGRQLNGIAELAGLASAAGIEVWLRGGWAMDFHLGGVTRAHVDVDWYCWRADADRLAGLLHGRGWRPDPRIPVDVQLDLVRDDVELSVAYLARDAAGRVVVGAGPWTGTALPEGMLAGPPGRIGPLTVPTISVAAQIEFKEMFPVWMPDRPRRSKDAADLARLRAAVAGHPRSVAAPPGTPACDPAAPGVIRTP
ncbi:nucleotidyltransferase domain-containing protein [Micromonospora sp. CPCC 205561]|uniref:nucleotidyltransferase domain-containing protein n=1 Tax=Micromonospora sp. CPCC 205561 TaxID=3122407 RepID=UPI002FF1FCA6